MVTTQIKRLVRVKEVEVTERSPGVVKSGPGKSQETWESSRYGVGLRFYVRVRRDLVGEDQ